MSLSPRKKAQLTRRLNELRRIDGEMAFEQVLRDEGLSLVHQNVWEIFARDYARSLLPFEKVSDGAWVARPWATVLSRAPAHRIPEIRRLLASRKDAPDERAWDSVLLAAFEMGGVDGVLVLAGKIR